LGIGNTKFNDWEDGIDNHSLGKSISYSGIPFWSKIIEWSLEYALKRKSNFSNVSLSENQKNTCIEELSDEYTIGNCLELR
jgi:hypothetical protein